MTLFKVISHALLSNNTTCTLEIITLILTRQRCIFHSVVGKRGKTAVTGKYTSFSLPSTTTEDSILGIMSNELVGNSTIYIDHIVHFLACAFYDVRREVV